MDDQSKMPFGEHKGKPLSEVPDSYLVWFYDQDDSKQSRPELYDYIVKHAHLFEDLILRQDDLIEVTQGAS